MNLQYLATSVMTLTLLVLAPAVRADHALLTDGRALFNVHVVDTHSTAARPLRVIYKPASFGYDYQRNTPFPLMGISGQYRIADFVTTTAEVGKARGRDLMAQRNWHRYVEPPRPTLRAPTPAPTVVVTPAPVATPLPVNVASPELPLQERVQAQLDMFMQEQSRLAAEIRTSESLRALTEEAGAKVRLQWLEAQSKVLDQYYPADEQIVRDAKAQWELQMQRVRGLGKFSFED